MNKRYKVEITATIQEITKEQLDRAVQIASAISIGNERHFIERSESDARDYIIKCICERLRFDSDLLVKWENYKDDDRNSLIGRLSIVAPEGHTPESLIAISKWRNGL